MLNGGIVPVNAGSSCTARSVEDGSRWTGVGDKEVVDTYEAFAPTGHDREKSRCSSQRAATSSREMVMEDPEQSTDGFWVDSFSRTFSFAFLRFRFGLRICSGDRCHSVRVNVRDHKLVVHLKA
jgi:hypothetical protein